MKEFVKILNQGSACFGYIYSKFPGQRNEKLKAGNFDGTQRINWVTMKILSPTCLGLRLLRVLLLLQLRKDS